MSQQPFTQAPISTGLGSFSTQSSQPSQPSEPSSSALLGAPTPVPAPTSSDPAPLAAAVDVASVPAPTPTPEPSTFDPTPSTSSSQAPTAPSFPSVADPTTSQPLLTQPATATSSQSYSSPLLPPRRTDATSQSQSQSQSQPADSMNPLPTPSPVSAFAAAQSLAALRPDAVAYVQAPPYVPPPLPDKVPHPSGRVGSPSIMINGEPSAGSFRMDVDQVTGTTVAAGGEKGEVTVGELKRLGLGRSPSGYCYDSRMMLHKPLLSSEKPGDLHPEQPLRISGIFKKMEGHGLMTRMSRIKVREAIGDEVMLIHSQAHWDRIRGTGYQSISFLDSCAEYFDRISLYVNEQSAYCARMSCGGVIEMCRAVAEGEIRNGFAIVRPPGHHAEPEDAMGFCFFNNAAVAAKWLRTIYDGESGPGINNGGGAGGASQGKKIDKVLILDWDVHHGNGTQKAFWNDPNVLYISLHRHDGSFYPGGTYGAADMVGQGAGEGFSVNIPFPEMGMADEDYIYAFQQMVMPIAYEFDPDFVIVSAGYDAADGDELGQMKVSPAGFAHMTHMLEVLANGKLVLALEGGYNVEAIANSAVACVEVLVGETPRPLKIGAASLSATNTVHEAMMVQRKYWKCMGTAIEGPDTLKDAGKPIPISEVLKAHRTFELFHEYGLYNIAFEDEVLNKAFKDQLLCTDNIYECETLVLFMHDLGNVKANFSAASMDIHLERTLLLDTSREVLDWAIKENKYGVVDVNFMAHLPTVKGIPSDSSRDKKAEKALALYIWDNMVTLSSAQNVVLFGSGCGCSALIAIVQNREAVTKRVKAAVSVLGMEPPPELDASSGNRTWYKQHSLVMLPSTHALHEDARKAGKHQKKFGNVHRATAEDESRPIYLIKQSFPRIKQFIKEQLPPAPAPVAEHTNGGDVEMSET